MTDTKDITLPYELALRGLSLKEIGAVFKSFSIMKMNKKDLSKFETDDVLEYTEIIENLLERGIISIQYDEHDNSTMTINLEDQEKEPFWNIYEYDYCNNPIYHHYSNYHVEGDQWAYRIRPVLLNMKVEWHDCSDLDLSLGEVEPFESLEEAERYYQELIDETAKYNKHNIEEKFDSDFWEYLEGSSLNENNKTYRHRCDYVDENCDIFYIRSMRTVNGNMWKLSTSINPEDSPELFSTKEQAQAYCEELISKERVKHTR
jgi:hypothetical protein